MYRSARAQFCMGNAAQVNGRRKRYIPDTNMSSVDAAFVTSFRKLADHKSLINELCRPVRSLNCAKSDTSSDGSPAKGVQLLSPPDCDAQN